jgi:LacI family repressor for deo operon, udp, cdd, tsx, nupC, and nupG
MVNVYRSGDKKLVARTNVKVAMDADEDAPTPPLPPPAAAGRPGAVRIADVAAVAGVSIATVSRALTNPGRVNAATRERVLEVVRRLGYTPNLAGRRLRAARSMMVLVVVPTFITPFFSELLLGVDQALSARGYGLLVGNLHGGVDKEEHLIDLVFAGGADGVVLLNGRVLRKGVRSLGHSGVPMVAVSVPPSADVPQVLVGEREAARAVAEHLLALGHRRFGYVTGPEGSYIERERWAGFSEALAGAGIGVDTIARYPGSFHVATGVQAARRFLAEPERPSAVFAVSDMMAIGFMRTLHAAGLVVPRDVSVVGFDGIEFADYCEPPLTTVRQPREAMGRAAAELLLRLIAGEEIPPAERILRLEAALRPAESTAPPPESS